MERSVAGPPAPQVDAPGRRARPPGRTPGRAAAWPVLAVLAVLAPTVLAAQRPDPDPPDTTVAAVPATPGDTLPADTTLSVRERALRRLLALPATPVQPDTVGPDSVPSDSAAAGPVPAAGDSAAQAPPPVVTPGADTLALPGLPAPTEADSPVGVPGGAPDPGLRSADSVMAALRSLEGYTATEYSGESAIYSAERNELELGGVGRIEREGSSLETDSLLVYDGTTGVVCGYGTPVLSGETDPVESDEVCFDINRRVGMAVGARTRFQQGATWYVRGAENRVYMLTGGEKAELYGERAEFTSCDLDHPHYAFRAGSLKMVEDETMVARDVTLRFADVPVFWLPWMVQSMKRDRRSGLLMPEFGVNDIVRNSTGYNRHLSNLGFYWAVNDYVSAKGTFEWYSSNWTALEGALTYRWLRQFLQGSLTAKQYWRQQEGAPASRERTLNTSNSWQPDERTSVTLNANYASSSDFVRDNSFDPRELNRRITSAASVNRSFDWGRLTVGADRQQQLSTGQVDMTLPSLNVTISPLTLFRNDNGLELTWSGSGSSGRDLRDVADTLPNVRDSEDLAANFQHRLSFGSLSLNQNASWSERTLAARSALEPDSAGLPEATTEMLRWSTGVSYQQVLWPGTTLSPSLSVNGNRLRSDTTGGVFVDEPTRISTGASLNTAIYGFWPGFGRFSRIRHKISPSVSWSYSPAPQVTALQERIFGARNVREQNTVSLSFNQTFEAKVREEESDTAAVDSVEAGPSDEPRRLPQAQKVELLALNTSTSFLYDFVAEEEEGRGFQTESVTNSIRSDLLEGLQVSITHDLFEEGTPTEPDALAPRRFDPFVTSLRASFSIDQDFWLFGLLGLSAGGSLDAEEDFPDTGAEGVAGSEDPDVGAEADPDRSPGGVGSIVGGRDARSTARSPGAGRWQASLDYSLQRTRPIPGAGEDTGRGGNQLLQGNIAFDPTELWSVRWSTAYSFTDGEFANHVLTLSRDLHRWTANFDFIKAQNGNFAMQFRVQLRDNPDLKLDYDQRTDPSERFTGRRP